MARSTMSNRSLAILVLAVVGVLGTATLIAQTGDQGSASSELAASQRDIAQATREVAASNAQIAEAIRQLADSVREVKGSLDDANAIAEKKPRTAAADGDAATDGAAEPEKILSGRPTAEGPKGVFEMEK